MDSVDNQPQPAQGATSGDGDAGSGSDRIDAERFELVGRLAAGISHELNNALSTVTTFADLVVAETPVGSPAREDLQEIKRAALGASAVVRRLALFSASTRPSGHEEVHVFQVVEGASKLLTQFFGRDVDFAASSDSDDVPPVRGAEAHVEEILFAVAADAREAVGRTGRVRIIVTRGGSDADPTAVLRIHDSGTGPRRRHSETTLVGRAVAAMSGTYSVERDPGVGAVVTVELPGVPPHEAVGGPDPTS